MATLSQATPFILVPDLAAAIDFFARVLGFTLQYTMWNYAYIRRDTAALRLLGEPSATVVDADHARCTVYVDLDDVDALFEELRPALEALPAGSWQPPIDQEWGQRELAVRMPDGHWLTFGHPARRSV
jgi:catechol 2,3-dioxygenase-like lactoylglutathione lyase family enzyme